MTQSQFNSFLSLSILVALVMSGCTPATPSPTPAPTLAPTLTPARFEAADCKFQVPAGISYKVECGNLSVPEDRSQPDSPLIQLHVAIVRSQSQNPAADPVVFLQGGWSYPTLTYMAYLLPQFKDVLENRDLIFFDQRGVGYSQPSLDCPEIPTQVYQDTVQNVGRDERVQNYIHAAQTCHDRLIGEGVNLAAYTTATTAADVNDLRIALGYSEWNLYGVSWGTTLALTVMHHFPTGVRSVILDSVYPPQENVFVEGAVTVERSFNLLAERCAADAECNRAYPDLIIVFYDLVAQLDANPRGPMNGNGLIETLWGWLYSSEMISWVPMYIYDFHNGNWASLPSQPVSLALHDKPGPDTPSEGKKFSVICGEEVRFTSPEEIEAANATVNPRLVEFFNEPIFTICSFWGAKPADPVEHEAVVSDIPALILQGDYDPATPPAWAKLAVETLSKAQYFEFPGISHGVLGAGLDGGTCSRKIVDAFLADPKSVSDSSCLEKMKPFFMTGSY